MIQFKEDFEKAEFHLNQNTWQGVWAARLPQLLRIAFAATVAIAINLILSTGADASVCGTRFKTLTYSAAFSWENAATHVAKPMRILVGTSTLAPDPARSEKPQLTAQIWSGKECMAVCEAKSFEKEGPFSPVSLEMTCKSAELGAVALPTTLLWGRGHSLSKLPTLRFGTWLHGYEQAALEVELDRYSMPASPRSPRLAYRAPAMPLRKVTQ
jgi:hypothetical protein